MAAEYVKLRLQTLQDTEEKPLYKMKAFQGISPRINSFNRTLSKLRNPPTVPNSNALSPRLMKIAEKMDDEGIYRREESPEKREGSEARDRDGSADSNGDTFVKELFQLT
jgi:hypothetical protein